MMMRELLAKARCAKANHVLRSTYALEIAEGLVELFETPNECGWPEPEAHTAKDGVKYVAWEAIGQIDIVADELRAIIAMLGRALAEVES